MYYTNIFGMSRELRFESYHSKLLTNPGLSSGPKLADDDSDDDVDSDADEQHGKNEQFQEEDFKIDPRDESAFNAFMNTNVEPRKTLADLVNNLIAFTKFTY